MGKKAAAKDPVKLFRRQMTRAVIIYSRAPELLHKRMKTLFISC